MPILVWSRDFVLILFHFTGKNNNLPNGDWVRSSVLSHQAWTESNCLKSSVIDLLFSLTVHISIFCINWFSSPIWMVQQWIQGLNTKTFFSGFKQVLLLVFGWWVKPIPNATGCKLPVNIPKWFEAILLIIDIVYLVSSSSNTALHSFLITNL